MNVIGCSSCEHNHENVELRPREKPTSIKRVLYDREFTCPDTGVSVWVGDADPAHKEKAEECACRWGLPCAAELY